MTLDEEYERLPDWHYPRPKRGSQCTRHQLLRKYTLLMQDLMIGKGLPESHPDVISAIRRMNLTIEDIYSSGHVKRPHDPYVCPGVGIRAQGESGAARPSGDLRGRGQAGNDTQHAESVPSVSESRAVQILREIETKKRNS